MISSWGVDHGVITKSYIPGKGWVSAANAGKKTLRTAQKGGNRYKNMRGVTERDKATRQSMQSLNEAMDTIPSKKTINLGRGRKVEQKESAAMPPGMEAFAYMSGKRRIIATKPGADPKFVKHELAHVTPKKRKAHRLAQINQNPKKAMREEARADFMGGMKWRQAPSKGQITSRQRSGDSSGNYSGYAAAARRRGMARDQRNVGRVADFTNRRAAKAQGMNPAMLPKRSSMFKQPAMGDYRKVQDKMDAARGTRYRFTANMKNRVNRSADVAFPTAGIAGVGYLGNKTYQDRKKVNRQMRNVRKSMYRSVPMSEQERRKYQRERTINGALGAGLGSGAATAAMNPINARNLKGAAAVGALGSGIGAGLSYHGAKKKRIKMVPVRSGSHS